MVKDGGEFLFGVPTGPDGIGFNEGRIYGPLMYSHMFANWEQIRTETTKEDLEFPKFSKKVNSWKEVQIEDEKRNLKRYFWSLKQPLHLLKKNVALFQEDR